MDNPREWNPVIFAFEGTWAAHSIFNPNEWDEESKAIIASCSAQFSLLLFVCSTLSSASEGVQQVCERRMNELQHQWLRAKWNLHQCRYFVPVPPVHLSIQAFLVTIKTLLDLLAQLMSTERLVQTKLHGFHKKGRNVGGEVLHALKNKRNPVRGEVATDVRSYILEQKAIWIDNAVLARDYLTHPKRGITQVMWELEVAAENDSIRCDQIMPPHIGDSPFDQFVTTTAAQMEEFSTTILQKLRAT
jgi:hypothetical protein